MPLDELVDDEELLLDELLEVLLLDAVLSLVELCLSLKTVVSRLAALTPLPPWLSDKDLRHTGQVPCWKSKVHKLNVKFFHLNV